MNSRKLTRTRGPSVAAILLHPGYTGYAAVDGYGVLGFGSSWPARATSDQASVLVRLVTRLVRAIRPERVVIGVPSSGARVSSVVERLVAEACRGLRCTVVKRRLGTALRRLGAPARSKVRNGLARHLVDHFVPELFHRFTDGLERLSRRRPSWHALALALSELVEVAPFAAAALVPAAGHNLPTFRKALQLASSRV